MTPTSDAPLRIALLVYRGNPHSGGQGVYVRHLSRELVELGHTVEVISGPPYPDLDPRVRLTPLTSLQIFDEPKLLRPKLRYFRGPVDLLELAVAATAGFPEPLTFSLRAWRHLARRRDEFDLVHDNQCLSYGILGIQRLGLPVMATLHHPITVDRRLELKYAGSLPRRLSLWRFFGFTRSQIRVARRMPHIVTVSRNSRDDIVADFGIPPERLSIVPVGVEADRWRPRPEVAEVPGRMMVTTSADAPLKGLVHLLEAVAKLRTERHVELTVVGRLRPGSTVPAILRRLGIEDVVTFVSGVSEDRLVELYAEAQVAVVPSLYEGFSLPAIEAMACGKPLVATTGGAIPEVVGTDGAAARLVPPGDAEALAAALRELLDDAALRARLGAAARSKVEREYTWPVVAAETVEHYRRVLAEHHGAAEPAGPTV